MTFQRWKPYDLPILLFFIGAVFGFTLSYDQSLSWRSLAALAGGYFLYVLISWQAVKRKTWLWTAGLLIGSGVFVAAYFITQAGHLDQAEKVGPVFAVARGISSIFPRFVIWNPLPNSVATFLEGIFFLAMGMSLALKPKSQKIPALTAAGLLGGALLISQSRGAWLGCATAAAAWLAVSDRRRGRWIGTAILVVIAILLVSSLWQENIPFLFDIPWIGSVLRSVFIRPDRLELYRNSLILIRDVPFTGIGLGDLFGFVYARYELYIPYVFLSYSHNLFLDTWLQQGLIGITALIWLAGVVGFSAFQKNAWEAPLGRGAWCGLAAIFVHAITDARMVESLWCWLPFFTLLGLHAALFQGYPSQGAGRFSRRAPAALAMVFVIAVVIGFWPVGAAFRANEGALIEQHAALRPGLAEAERAVMKIRAYDEFRRVLDADPDNVTAHFRSGLISLEAGDHPSAVEHLTIAYQLAPQAPGIRKTLGLALAWTGEIEKASPLLQNVPQIVDELNYWGWYFSERGQFQAGLNAYLLSLRFNPLQPTVQGIVERLKLGLYP